MYTELYIPVIKTVCPETKNEQNCPVRQYLENDQNLFHVSFFGNYLVPNSYDTKKIAEGINKMRKICEECGNNKNR